MTGFNPLARQMIVAREVGRCFRCGVYLVDWCTMHALDVYSIHHRRARGMGGSKDAATNHPSNGLLLCGSGTYGCHGWVESHRAAALADGYLVPQGKDPASVPVRLPSGGWVWLDGDLYRYSEVVLP